MNEIAATRQGKEQGKIKNEVYMIAAIPYAALRRLANVGSNPRLLIRLGQRFEARQSSVNLRLSLPQAA